jgi:hypothetical protein
MIEAFAGTTYFLAPEVTLNVRLTSFAAMDRGWISFRSIASRFMRPISETTDVYSLGKQVSSSVM